MMSVIIFILILGLLVLIHEFGHFIAAKKAGIRVDEFGFGFPPKVFGYKIGETLYTLNLIPIGGFVRLYGEEYHEIKNHKTLKNRTFAYKNFTQKTVVILGGVIMNLILAIAVYYILLMSSGFKSEAIPLIGTYDFRFGKQEGLVVVNSINPGSPAAKVGITSEDAVIRYRIPEENTRNWHNLKNANELINAVKNRTNKPIILDLFNIKSGQVKSITVTPYYNKELKRAIIGAGLVDAVIIKYNTPNEKIFSGFYHSYNMFAYNLVVIKRLFSFSYQTKTIAPVAEAMSGPVGIFAVIDEIVKSSGQKLFVNLANIIALLSLSLALMNLLPFPALDGGRFVFILYEALFRKRINQTVERYINNIGFIFLILLAIVISVNDIFRFFIK